MDSSTRSLNYLSIVHLHIVNNNSRYITIQTNKHKLLLSIIINTTNELTTSVKRICC